MKKHSLAIAVATLLTTSISFAADLTEPNNNTAQIFTQSFDVSVKKESVINIDPPKREMIHLYAEELEKGMENNKPIEIGAMEIESTAKTCFATVKTENDFKLKGAEQGEILASYGLYYRTNTSASETSLDMIPEAKFASNADGEMSVSCNTADLAMRVFKYNEKAPADAYNDVVTVEVRAES